jgi:hypothetical protein
LVAERVLLLATELKRATQSRCSSALVTKAGAHELELLVAHTGSRRYSSTPP